MINQSILSFSCSLLASRDAEDTVEIELPGKKYDDMVEFLCCVYPNILSPVTGTSTTVGTHQLYMTLHRR